MSARATPMRVRWRGVLATCLVVVMAACSDDAPLGGWCGSIAEEQRRLEAGEPAAWSAIAEDAPAEHRADAEAVAAAVREIRALSAGGAGAPFEGLSSFATGMGEALPRLQGVVAESCEEGLPSPALAG